MVIKNITNLHKLCKYAYMQIFILNCFYSYDSSFNWFLFLFFLQEFFSEVYEINNNKEIIKIIIQCNNYNRSGVYRMGPYMNYMETCTDKLQFFSSLPSSNYRPLTSVLHVRPGWIIYQNTHDFHATLHAKFQSVYECTAKKMTGGGSKRLPPPPNGIRVKWKLKFQLQ